MAIKGDLRLFHPIEVFQLIKSNRETGVLLVASPSMLVGVYFVDGDVAYATKAKKMYDFFAKKKFSIFLKALKEKQATGVDMEDELWQEVIAALLDLTLLKEGMFSFEEASFFLEGGFTPVLIPTEMLIIEATRRLSDWDIVGKKISSMELIFAKNREWKETSKRAELIPDEERVLEAIDGERNVAAVVNQTGLPSEEVTKILFGLLCAGFIGRATRKPPLKKRWLTRGLLRRLVDRIKGI
jgi:hypothetical protein